MKTRRTARFTAALMLPMVLLAGGCGSDSDEGSGTAGTAAPPATETETETSGTPAGSSATTAAGTSGEELDLDAKVRIGYAGPLDTLDPHKPTIQTWQVYNFLTYDRLFSSDNDFALNPQLATEYSFADDGSYLEVMMRDDVTFHDGTPVDAAAVKASIERGKTVAASTVANALSGISSVEVVDPYTVRFLLDGAGAEVPAILATNAGAIMNPKVLADPSVNMDTAPPAAAGSGPYVVKSSVPNVKTEWVRAPEVWQEGTGNLAEVSVEFIPQNATRLAALQAGDLDLVQLFGDGLEAAKPLAEDGDIELYMRPHAAGTDMFLNIERPALADPRVREAIAIGIDREEIAATYYNGDCLVNDQPYPEGHWANNPDVKVEYDPERAKELIGEVGGAAFEFTVAAGSINEGLATVIQDQLADIGIDVTVRPVEQAATNPGFNAGELDMTTNAITPRPDPSVVVNTVFLNGPTLAKGELRTEVEALAGEALDPGLSQEERGALYQEIFAKMVESHAFIRMCNVQQAWGATLPMVDVVENEGINTGLPNFARLAVAAN